MLDIDIWNQDFHALFFHSSYELLVGHSLFICLTNMSGLYYLFALFLISRLEYEQKRDVKSRILKLESSLVTFENDLKEIQNKEADVKSSTEKATSEINRLKEEVRGMNFFCMFISYQLLANLILNFWSYFLKKYKKMRLSYNCECK